MTLRIWIITFVLCALLLVVVQVSNVPSSQHPIVSFLPMLVYMTVYIANIITFHQPLIKILVIIVHNLQAYHYLIKMNYFFIFILSVKGTLLFALFTSDWWPITFFRICTSLTFTTNKCSYGIAIFTGRWLTIRFHILLTFLTNSACITLSAN